MSGHFDERRARRLTRRAHLAFFAGWLPLSGLFVLFAPAIVVIGFSAERDDLGPLAGVALAAAIGWLGTYFLLVFGSVWWYRRGISRAFASPEPGARMQARRLAEVTAHFVHFGGTQLVGVELGSCEPTAVVRFVNGPVATVLHIAAVGLIVIAVLANP